MIFWNYVIIFLKIISVFVHDDGSNFLMNFLLLIEDWVWGIGFFEEFYDYFEGSDDFLELSWCFDAFKSVS